MCDRAMIRMTSAIFDRDVRRRGRPRPAAAAPRPQCNAVVWTSGDYAATCLRQTLLRTQEEYDTCMHPPCSPF